MTEFDIQQLENQEPEVPDLEGLASEAIPAEDPGPEGELDMQADGEEGE